MYILAGLDNTITMVYTPRAIWNKVLVVLVSWFITIKYIKSDVWSYLFDKIIMINMIKPKYHNTC